jgi:hypothetical protein
MTKQEFSKYLEQRLQRIKDTLDKKGEEYAPNINIFSNFNKAQDIIPMSREEIMFIYATKHLVSVIEIVEGRKLPKAQIEEKFGDLVNYLILIEASLLEQIKD